MTFYRPFNNEFLKSVIKDVKRWFSISIVKTKLRTFILTNYKSCQQPTQKQKAIMQNAYHCDTVTIFVVIWIFLLIDLEIGARFQASHKMK